MESIKKRLIMRENVPIRLGANAALQFYRDYVEGAGIKTGEYHNRAYTGSVEEGDNGNKEVTVQVWHTESSVIVALPPKAPKAPEAPEAPEG